MAPLWIVAAGIVLTVIFGDLPGRQLYIAVLQNGCHAPAFAVLSIVMLTLLAPLVHAPFARAFLTLGTMLLLGIATEAIQSLLGRDAELEDVVSDVVGSLGTVSVFLYLRWRARKDSLARTGRICAVLVCAAATAYWVEPFVQCARAYHARDAQFPILAQFRTKLDLAFISSTGTNTHIVAIPATAASPAETALETTLDTGPWPGITLSEPVPDWRGYHVLALDVGNPGRTELPLGFRVNDRSHRGENDDRFNMPFRLAPGVRETVRIPLERIEHSPRTRRMDMSHISQLILFRGGGAPGQVVRLYRIWLE
jgi:hypothetical protein